MAEFTSMSLVRRLLSVATTCHPCIKLPLHPNHTCIAIHDKTRHINNTVATDTPVALLVHRGGKILAFGILIILACWLSQKFDLYNFEQN